MDMTVMRSKSVDALRRHLTAAISICPSRISSPKDCYELNPIIFSDLSDLRRLTTFVQE